MSSLGKSEWQLQQSLLDLEQQLLLPEVVDLEEFVWYKYDEVGGL